MDGKSSEEQPYMVIENGGRGLLSFKYIYNMAKIMISNYLILTEGLLLQTITNRSRPKTNSK